MWSTLAVHPVVDVFYFNVVLFLAQFAAAWSCFPGVSTVFYSTWNGFVLCLTTWHCCFTENVLLFYLGELYFCNCYTLEMMMDDGFGFFWEKPEYFKISMLPWQFPSVLLSKTLVPNHVHQSYIILFSKQRITDWIEFLYFLYFKNKKFLNFGSFLRKF